MRSRGRTQPPPVLPLLPVAAMGVVVGQEALGVYAALWSLLPLPGLVDAYSAGSEAGLGTVAALAIDLPLLVLTSMLLRLLVRWWLGQPG